MGASIVTRPPAVQAATKPPIRMTKVSMSLKEMQKMQKKDAGPQPRTI